MTKFINRTSMFKSARKSQIIILLSLLFVMLPQTTKADPADFTAKDKLPAFLSEVLGLDLTKYDITESSGFSYPSEYGGLVKQEVISYHLDCNGSRIDIMGIFFNEFIYAIDILPNQGPLIYTQQPSTDELDKTRDILERYQIFAQNYGMDASHVDSALNMLDEVSDLTEASITEGNTKLEITIFQSNPNMDSAKNVLFSWMYTAEGVDFFNKRLEISLYGNASSFKDTWNLFSIGSFSVISEGEAKSIAWDAAQSYDMVLIGENDTLVHVDPEWSNRSSINLRMIPGQIHNIDPEYNAVNAGNATRDPLALYPMWHVAFALNHSLGGVDGIQVGVWGDTSEIAYISEYGHLGGPPINIEPELPTEPPTEEPETTPTEQTEPEPENNPDTSTENSEEQTAPEATQTENSNPFTNTYLIVGLAIAATATVLAAVALKKRRK